MKKALYLGNKTSSYKITKTTMETLEPLLAEFINLKTSSNKKNKIFRFFSMLFDFYRYGLTSDFIIIDVYSTLAFYYAVCFGQLSKTFNIKYILVLHGGDLPMKYKLKPNLINYLFKNSYKVIHFFTFFF